MAITTGAVTGGTIAGTFTSGEYSAQLIDARITFSTGEERVFLDEKIYMTPDSGTAGDIDVSGSGNLVIGGVPLGQNWVVTTGYFLQNVVSHDGRMWISTLNGTNTGEEPSLTAANWEVVSPKRLDRIITGIQKPADGGSLGTQPIFRIGQAVGSPRLAIFDSTLNLGGSVSLYNNAPTSGGNSAVNIDEVTFVNTNSTITPYLRYFNVPEGGHLGHITFDSDTDLPYGLYLDNLNTTHTSPDSVTLNNGLLIGHGATDAFQFTGLTDLDTSNNVSILNNAPFDLGTASRFLATLAVQDVSLFELRNTSEGTNTGIGSRFFDPLSVTDSRENQRRGVVALTSEFYARVSRADNGAVIDGAQMHVVGDAGEDSNTLVPNNFYLNGFAASTTYDINDKFQFQGLPYNTLIVFSTVGVGVSSITVDQAGIDGLIAAGNIELDQLEDFDEDAALTGWGLSGIGGGSPRTDGVVRASTNATGFTAPGTLRASNRTTTVDGVTVVPALAHLSYYQHTSQSINSERLAVPNQQIARTGNEPTITISAEGFISQQETIDLRGIGIKGFEYRLENDTTYVNVDSTNVTASITGTEITVAISSIATSAQANLDAVAHAIHDLEISRANDGTIGKLFNQELKNGLNVIAPTGVATSITITNASSQNISDGDTYKGIDYGTGTLDLDDFEADGTVSFLGGASITNVPTSLSNITLEGTATIPADSTWVNVNWLGTDLLTFTAGDAYNFDVASDVVNTNGRILPNDNTVSYVYPNGVADSTWAPSAWERLNTPTARIFQVPSSLRNGVFGVINVTQDTTLSAPQLINSGTPSTYTYTVRSQDYTADDVIRFYWKPLSTLTNSYNVTTLDYSESGLIEEGTINLPINPVPDVLWGGIIGSLTVSGASASIAGGIAAFNNQDGDQRLEITYTDPNGVYADASTGATSVLISTIFAINSSIPYLTLLMRDQLTEDVITPGVGDTVVNSDYAYLDTNGADIQLVITAVTTTSDDALNLLNPVQLASITGPTVILIANPAGVTPAQVQSAAEAAIATTIQEQIDESWRVSGWLTQSKGGIRGSFNGDTAYETNLTNGDS